MTHFAPHTLHPSHTTPLQERFSDLKAEVRQLLVKQGVKSMRMVPVKRNYAFEDPNVATGEQWVLKVGLWAAGGQWRR